MKQSELWYIKLDNNFKLQSMYYVSDFDKKLSNMDNYGNYNSETNSLVLAIDKKDPDMLHHVWWLLDKIKEDLSRGNNPKLRQLEI